MFAVDCASTLCSVDAVWWLVSTNDSYADIAVEPAISAYMDNAVVLSNLRGYMK